MIIKTQDTLAKTHVITDDGKCPYSVHVVAAHDATAKDMKESFRSKVTIASDDPNKSGAVIRDMEPDDIMAVAKLLEQAANVIRSERVEMRSRAREA